MRSVVYAVASHAAVGGGASICQVLLFNRQDKHEADPCNTNGGVKISTNSSAAVPIG